jgi:hypothetical protein
MDFAETVFVVENEITYLACSPVDFAIVVFDEGYAAPRLGPLIWLAELPYGRSRSAIARSSAR